jgi:antitoxin VapB
MSNVVKPHRLLILACSNVKRVSVRPMPARDRYDGPLWQTLRHADPLEQKARVAFVSARCGFRAATSPVEQYDCLLSEEIAGRMKAGGLGTRWPRPDIHRGIILPREHAGKHIHAMTRGGTKPFDDFCLVGGALCRRHAPFRGTLPRARLRHAQRRRGGDLRADRHHAPTNGRLAEQAGRRWIVTAPLRFPTVTLEEIGRPELNVWLTAWQHRMGPIRRPYSGWAHALLQDGRPVAVASTDRLIRQQAAGLTRSEAVELSRLGASRPDLSRAMLWLWRVFVFPELAIAHGFRWAISYQDKAMHKGNLYRFDGWIALALSNSGTDSRSGRRGRRKVVWGWCDDEDERRSRPRVSTS